MIKEVYFKTGLACAIALMSTSNLVKAADCNGGSGYCLVDGESQLQIDSYGTKDFSVSGVRQVYSSDIIIAEKAPAGMMSPNPLALMDYVDLNQAQDQDQSTLSLTGMAVSTWGHADLNIQLIDGAVGSNTSTLIETFTITNHSAANVDLSLFSYTDPDVGGSTNALDDQAEIHKYLKRTRKPIAFRVWDNNYEVITSVDVAPDYYEVDLNNNCVFDLCERIYFGIDNYLPNTIYSQVGDIHMATQWVRTLAAGESFSYTQTIELSPVAPKKGGGKKNK